MGSVISITRPNAHVVYDRILEGNIYVPRGDIENAIVEYREMINQMVGNLWPNILGRRIDRLREELENR